MTEQTFLKNHHQTIFKKNMSDSRQLKNAKKTGFYLKSILAILTLIVCFSCGPKLPATVAQKWIGESEAKLKKHLKNKGYVKKGDYYITTQELRTPLEKSKKVENRKTGEVHYTPPNGDDQFLMTTKYYVKNDKVVKWEIIYSSITQD